MRSPVYDIPSIWDEIEDAYESGTSLTAEDKEVLFQYVMGMMTNVERRELGNPNIPPDPEIPMQSIPDTDESIPLLSTDQLNKLLDDVNITRVRYSDQYKLLDAPLGLRDRDNPFFNMITNYRKYADVAEYEQDKEDPEFDIPYSLFKREQLSTHRDFYQAQPVDFQDNFYKNYPKYRGHDYGHQFY